MRVCDKCENRDSVELVQIRTLLSHNKNDVRRMVELCSGCRRRLNEQLDAWLSVMPPRADATSEEHDQPQKSQWAP
jgi:hypothetical protein